MLVRTVGCPVGVAVDSAVQQDAGLHGGVETGIQRALHEIAQQSTDQQVR